MELSMTSRVLLPALWIEAWDDGVIEWRPLRMKARIFPCDNVNMVDLLGELSRLDFIREFEVEGKKYAAIRNFRKWQSPQKPNSSKVLPADLEDYVQLHYKSDTGTIKPIQKGRREEGKKGGREEDRDSSRRAEEKPSAPPSSAPSLDLVPAVPKPNLEAEFETWWQVYPGRMLADQKLHKAGKQTAKAQFIIARKKASLETLTSAVEAYARATNPQYVVDAERWLKREKWADEVAAVPEGAINLPGPSNPNTAWGAQARQVAELFGPGNEPPILGEI